MPRSDRWKYLALLGGLCVSQAVTPLAPVFGQDLDYPRVALARDHQCQIEVKGTGTVFAIYVTGLVPNETIEITSDSEGEVIRSLAQADERGEHFFIDIPLVKGRSSGIAHIFVTASRCRLKVSFPWRE
ncbi:hypothetical protein [Croceicoccus bisphenolivorans]|uniref:hypothetical protein n=1 Tax=Croceicoccus bisphenolivorans TaxID=1783232 RepID=UPI000836409D|nr:hypothetical protein [Croceicoccus bisphenolivorans]